MHCMIAASREMSDEPYNVSNRRKIYVYQIIDNIEKSLPYKVTHEYIDGTPGDQIGVYGVNNKIVSDLNWTPKISFEDGMAMMIKWAINKDCNK